MYSLDLLQCVKDAYPVLQASLDKGWQDCQNQDFFLICSQLYQQMDWWYISQYYGVIPNPAHWYSSQQGAKFFLEEIGKLGIYFNTVFPGDFAQSEEFQLEDGSDVRRFKLPAFYQVMPVCIFQLDFIHNHETFYFNEPPRLTILDP